MQFKSGDLFYVKMTNTAEKNLYVYLYSIGTSGKINLLYPTQNAKETLKPNLPFTSVAASGCYGIFQVGKAEDTPLGKETLKLIATTEPFPAELLTSPAVAKAAQRATVAHYQNYCRKPRPTSAPDQSKFQSATGSPKISILRLFGDSCNLTFEKIVKFYSPAVIFF
ncbi:MAG: hypothetical protein WKF71_01215 [Pyrinomonadaceae bacterium]